MNFAVSSVAHLSVGVHWPTPQHLCIALSVSGKSGAFIRHLVWYAHHRRWLVPAIAPRKVLVSQMLFEENQSNRARCPHPLLSIGPMGVPGCLNIDTSPAFPSASCGCAP